MKTSKLQQTQEEQLLQQETTYSIQKKMDILEQIKLNLVGQSKPLKICLKCEKCGKMYLKKIYEMRKAIRKGYQHYYCSKKCSCQTNSTNQRKKYYCKNCGKELLKYGIKYCSKECKLMCLKELEKIICPICKKQFQPKSHRTIYCSMICKNKAHSIKMKGKGNSHYKSGSSYLKEFEDIRPKILNRDNYKCQICGKSEAPMKNKRYGTITNLRVHHINQNIKDNSSKNLVTLCQSCHIKLHKTKK